MQIQGETFRVEVEGEASRPALLMSNSLGTDLTMWDGLVPALRERFRLVRYDTRGHGGSDVPERPVSIERLGRDVIAILDALEIPKAHFCGLSMGGAIGQWLLAHAPERIERAVLACTATKFGLPDDWNARILAVTSGGMEAIADQTMDRWFSPAFHAADPQAVARVREMFVACPPQGYVACCAALRDLDLHAAIEDAETPVLVVTGSDDPVVDTVATAKLLAALPAARHVELPARHIAAIEARDAFLDAVVSFLTAKLPARRRAVRAPVPAPRGRVARRVTAARLPLAKPRTVRKAKTAAAKAAAAKARKPAAARPKARRPSPDAARLAKVAGAGPAKKAAAPARKTATRTKPAKPTATKPGATKTTTKSGATKTARRAPKPAAVRGAVKKATSAKAKATKAASKAPAKKTTKLAKRAPASRRTAAKAPRRPTGRRKT